MKVKCIMKKLIFFLSFQSADNKKNEIRFSCISSMFTVANARENAGGEKPREELVCNDKSRFCER